MTNFFPTSRIASTLAMGLLLAACNDTVDDAVRNGPQAVHPSPSALAQGATLVACGEEGQPSCE